MHITAELKAYWPSCLHNYPLTSYYVLYCIIIIIKSVVLCVIVQLLILWLGSQKTSYLCWCFYTVVVTWICLQVAVTASTPPMTIVFSSAFATAMTVTIASTSVGLVGALGWHYVVLPPPLIPRNTIRGATAACLISLMPIMPLVLR